MSLFLAAARMQLSLLRLDNLLALVTVPLTTAAFLSIVQFSGRTDLEAYAVVAPALIGLLNMALQVSGEVVATDRTTGVFEGLLATPSSLSVVLLARITTVTGVSLLALPCSALTGLAFGVSIRLFHPALFAVTIVVTAIAMSCTAVLMSAVFVLARSARTFQNSLSYPLILLSGALVPVSYLPEWTHPLSRGIFLSWAADLLRDCLSENTVGDPALRIGAVLVLGALGFALGQFFLHRLVRRAKALGTVGFT